MRPLTALLITDGRPGHYHLAEGIVAAIARARPVWTQQLPVRRRPIASGRLLAFAVNRGWRDASILRLGYGLTPDRIPPADLIVSAGAETLAASIAAARITGAPNIFYGSLRDFRPSDFALVLTSYIRQVRAPHPVMTLKPSRLDPDTLPSLAGRLPFGPKWPPKVAGLLLGGNDPRFRYGPDDWWRLVDFIGDFHRATGTRWIVSNSRRTPPPVGDRLTELAAGQPAMLEFIDVRKEGAGTLRDLLARAEAVVCTEDSSSMISEAVWARRPVIGVSPVEHGFTPDEASYRGYLAESGWSRSLAIGDLTPDRLLAALAEVHPLDRNPQADLCALLREKLPPIFVEKR